MLQRWIQTAHGRVLLAGLGWLLILPLLWLALQVLDDEKVGWRLLGSLALWTFASPVVGAIGVVLAAVLKTKDGPDAQALAKTRVAGIFVHAVILLISAALLWNGSRS